MTDEWRHDMMRRYPQLFGQSGYPTVGEGWRDLLDRALARIAAAVAGEGSGGGLRIVQIKEKFGSLRLYYHGHQLSKAADAKVREAVELAEARSACTCEECGAEGQLYNRSGWYMTRCPRHADGKPVQFKPGWENLRVVRTVERGKFRVVSCRRYDRDGDIFVEAPLPPDFDEDS